MKVVDVQPVKVGFKPHKMIQAQARGRIFNPNEITSVEVRIVSEDRATLESLLAHELAREAARRYLHRPFRVSPKGIGHRAEGYSRIFVVE